MLHKASLGNRKKKRNLILIVISLKYSLRWFVLTVNHFADIYGMPSMCQTVGPREEVLSLFFKVFFFFISSTRQ